MSPAKYSVLLSCCALAACMETTAPTNGVSSVNRKANETIVNYTFEQPADYTNPCNGEQIIGTARYHILVAVVNTQSGMTMTNSDLDINFEGVGVVTGAHYTGTQQSNTNYSLGQGATEITAQEDVRIISNGSAPNFIAKVKIHATLNAGGVPTANHELTSSKCTP